MGGSSGMGGGKTSAPTPPPPAPVVPEPGHAEDMKRIQEAKRREAERLKRQAGANVATGTGGSLGTARVGRKTLG